MLSRRLIWIYCGIRAARGIRRSSYGLGSRNSESVYNCTAVKLTVRRPKMRRTTAATLVLILVAVLAAASVNAQTRHRREREPKETERAAPAVSIDKRDTTVTQPAPFAGKPYWLALAQCGGT